MIQLPGQQPQMQPQGEKPSFGMAIVYLVGSLIIYGWVMGHHTPDWALSLIAKYQHLVWK